jgi:LL-diaminopimelate aminotransferase
VDLYRERRDVLVDGLNKLGWSVAKPSATFYVWTPVPGGGDAADFASRVLAEADVVIVPGSGFGRPGERYVRFALTVPTERIHEALERMSRMNFGT